MKTVASNKKIRGWAKYLTVEHHPSSGMHTYTDLYVYEVPESTPVPKGATVMSFADALEASR